MNDYEVVVQAMTEFFAALPDELIECCTVKTLMDHSIILADLIFLRKKNSDNDCTSEFWDFEVVLYEDKLKHLVRGQGGTMLRWDDLPSMIQWLQDEFYA